MNHYFLLSALKLPVRSDDYAVDLDGDDIVDNRLGVIFSSLMAQGFDLQGEIDQAVRSGKVLILFTVIAEQPLTVDQDAQLQIVRALGTGVADPLAVPVTLNGKVKARRFTTNAPAVGSDLFTWVLELPLGPGLPARLAVQWPRIDFGIASSGTGLIGGGLTGSISSKTAQDEVIPAVAKILTQFIVDNPNTETSRTIKQLFDTGGCENPDNTKAVKGDGVISPCELSQSALMKALLAPDIQLFNENGKYGPVPNGERKDSLSLAFGFTATAVDSA